MPTSLSLSITYCFPFLTCLSVCDLWNEVSASLRSLRETQILRPYPAPTESEALGWHLTSCVLIGVFFFFKQRQFENCNSGLKLPHLHFIGYISSNRVQPSRNYGFLLTNMFPAPFIIVFSRQRSQICMSKGQSK